MREAKLHAATDFSLTHGSLSLIPTFLKGGHNLIIGALRKL